MAGASQGGAQAPGELCTPLLFFCYEDKGYILKRLSFLPQWKHINTFTAREWQKIKTQQNNNKNPLVKSISGRCFLWPSWIILDVTNRCIPSVSSMQFVSCVSDNWFLLHAWCSQKDMCFQHSDACKDNLHQPDYLKTHWINLYVSVLGWGYMWQFGQSERQLVGVSSLLPSLGSGDQTHIIRLGGKHPDLMSHLGNCPT